jgi:hypothetical protein
MIALPNLVPGEVTTARICFTLSAAWVLIIAVSWELRSGAGWLYRLIVGCVSGCVICFLFPASLRWINARSKPNKSFEDSGSTAETTTTTPENAESHLNIWLHSFNGTVQKVPREKDMYFHYRLVWQDGTITGVGRRSNMYQQYLSVHGVATLTARQQTFLDSLSYSKIGDFAREIRMVIAMSKMHCSFVAPYHIAEVENLIPISAVTESRFMDVNDDIHANIHLLLDAINKQLERLGYKPPKQPSPTPDKEERRQ